jgi:hypothetical protein
VIDLYYWPTPNGHKITPFVPWEMQWEDLHHAEPKLPAQGFEIAFLSTDRPEILYSSLKAAGIHYTLHFDTLFGGGERIPCGIPLRRSTIAKEKQYGVDLEATTGTTQHALPVPCVHHRHDGYHTIRLLESRL